MEYWCVMRTRPTSNGMTLKEVEKLAELARLEIPENEMQEFLDNLQSILGYVGQIQEVAAEKISNFQVPISNENQIYNVMREDENPRESGTYTEKILAEAPETQDGYFKVKQIL